MLSVQVIIEEWESDRAIRLPNAVLQTLGLAVGDRLYLKTTRNGVVLSRHPNPSLEELLAPLLENKDGHMF
ncbi:MULTISPECIES: AbrB/MazE/SpoVT family DNA-binding domain-containing protein [Pseudomonas]|uniref:AbrB/MazE/SpoVT family DNA-binding domain-containing protein n=1 Tax=Pseudomonas TaxID=286 RepID=UPI001CBB53E0|nr:AbrB/MazE/SpoVT family DNA-binding domain-containing protein [Pseudomonas sp. BF-R-30]